MSTMTPGKDQRIVMLPLDFSGNCISRTILIADMLSDSYEIYIVGLSSCEDVWQPVKPKLELSLIHI